MTSPITDLHASASMEFWRGFILVGIGIIIGMVLSKWKK
jgi:hypothetical protein